MKKNFCVWALLCLFIFSACKSEGDAYQAAMSSDDMEVLYQFLEEYPDAPAEHRDSIACKIENQRYKGAMETNDIAVLEEYLSLFPDAPKDHYDNVSNKKEDLSIQNALYSTITDGVDIVASYQAAETYMSNHPEGIYATEVKAFIEKEAEAYKAELENRMKEQYEAKYGELIRNKTPDAHHHNVEEYEKLKQKINKEQQAYYEKYGRIDARNGYCKCGGRDWYEN